KEKFDMKNKMPLTMVVKKNYSIPVSLRAVKKVGNNLWHLERLAIIKSKRVFFSRTTVEITIDSARIEGMYFASQEKAESTARIIVANNARTRQHLVGDVIHSKTLEITNERAA